LGDFSLVPPLLIGGPNNKYPNNKSVGIKLSREGSTKKRPKNSKIDRKIALLCFFRGGGIGKTDQK